ncbi:DUF3307 domain-containing protein [Zavarzinella formosa]|uniref:DUF3307 domain-containing protein n=1 Tax=Zavarzinella formosa TaxID=360055 RepID=UPI0002D39144|nr:DUF3307 domain-containing protein [Zavarzinella formosa]
MITLFFLLMCAHALCDFTFQSGPMSVEKNRHSRSDLQKAVPWYYWLSAHAFIHGGAVYLVTRSITLGLIEAVLHWIIDFAKCENWTNIHSDQFLHLLCRISYCWLIWSGTAPAWDASLFGGSHLVQ